MLKILVAGDVDADRDHEEEVRGFGQCLGAALIRQGHIVLGSCRNEFDRIVAEAGENQLKEQGKDPAKRVISYVLADQRPVHFCGAVRQSRLHDWELGSPGLTTPESIELADAVILVGGSHGTHRAANWARIVGKPLLPVARFAGAAREVYYEELDRFGKAYLARVERSDYENLADVSMDLEKFAHVVVSLAERVISSSDVLVAMSFSGDPDLEDAYDSFKAVCGAKNYSCNKVGDETTAPRLLPELLNRIAGCAFVIVDLSDEKVNVYYELGYADALAKPLIVTAKEGTRLPFDVKDIPVIFWKNQKGLREQLSKKIAAIAELQGR